MAFHIGQKVVCVDNSKWEHRLVLRGVYTISAIDKAWGEFYIGLEETPNHMTGHPLQWRAVRFRPIVQRKTDTSVFTRMLTPKRAKSPAPVIADHRVSTGEN